jgi:hypothetical protein
MCCLPLALFSLFKDLPVIYWLFPWSVETNSSWHLILVLWPILE